jgi:glycerophosphoryl diester phosphodiesterase
VATLRLAHRGDWRVAPENTLAAFVSALAIPGCDGLEFDVRTSADGVPVVIHDATLAREQGSRGRVRDLGADALGRLGVPTLAGVMAFLPDWAFLDIEVKDDPGPVFEEILEASRGTNLDRAVVSSFEPAIVSRVGRARPSWPFWLNVRDLRPATLQIAADLGCTGVACVWPAITAGALERVAAAGLVLAAWTVRDPVTYRALEHAGVVAICAEAEALDPR